MKYYLIAGEPSGDLHGANLIEGLRKADPEARLRFWGGDLHGRRGRRGEPGEALPRNLVFRHRAGAQKPADDQTADARMPGRRGGVRPRRADPGRLPRLQHEDGALGQGARHPHLLLHRPEGLGVARVAGEGDPPLGGPAVRHLPLRTRLLPPARRRTDFRGQPARGRHRGPSAPRSPRPTSSAAARARRAGRSSPCLAGSRRGEIRDNLPLMADLFAQIPGAPVRRGGRGVARPRALRTVYGRQRHPLRLRPDLRDARRGRSRRGDVRDGDARNGAAGHSRSGGLQNAYGFRLNYSLTY